MWALAELVYDFLSQLGVFEAPPGSENDRKAKEHAKRILELRSEVKNLEKRRKRVGVKG
ncbi:MAG: hypothetical protein MN733_40435 [Nitrososphaera sp.]|nr:hypothetical protein [Nitrososphaera sp.]